MTDTQLEIVAGVDTHADTHWAAIITMTGQHVADKQFPATPDGYARLIEFITGHGRLARVGAEGTSPYGAGLTRVLLAAGINTVEVTRPKRSPRRRGKPADTASIGEVTAMPTALFTRLSWFESHPTPEPRLTSLAGQRKGRPTARSHDASNEQ
jgi:hypothetical protein